MITQVRYENPRMNATLIVLSLALCCLYIAWTLQDTELLHHQLAQERRRRELAEANARAKGEQMDGALEKIQELASRVDQLADPRPDADDE